MQNRNLSLGFCAAAIVAVAVLGPAPRSMAQQEKVLHSFGNGTDASTPQGNLVSDAAGNFYSTTYTGGAYGQGTVYELSPKAGGGWTERTLHSFGHGADGSSPRSGVIFDKAGNLYGTTITGGFYGQGAVFELLPKADGGWTEKLLHSFNGTDGEYGWDKLIFDTAGNLYSTTTLGGAYGQGNIYELTPKAGGGWTAKVLHNFGNGADGAQPQGGLILDAAGNFYGATTYGGTQGYGTVFELSPKAGGGWTEKVLHSFASGTDGANPFSGVIFDAVGNLYGTTFWGGATSGYGTVYELTPNSVGGWTENTLYSFPNNYGADGSNPWPTVTFDAAGNLYGTAQFGGGSSPGGGTAFELSPAAGGGWNFTVLHTFESNGIDGLNPSFTNIFLDASGNLYGTTGGGGTYGVGTVYEITP